MFLILAIVRVELMRKAVAAKRARNINFDVITEIAFSKLGGVTIKLIVTTVQMKLGVTSLTIQRTRQFYPSQYFLKVRKSETCCKKLENNTCSCGCFFR